MRGKFSEHQTTRSILRSLPDVIHDDVRRAGIGDNYGRLFLRPEPEGASATSGTSDNQFATPGARGNQSEATHGSVQHSATSGTSDDLSVATGICGAGSDFELEMDFLRLYNSVRVSGNIPWAMTDTLIVPDNDERKMKKLLRKLGDIAHKYGVDIVSGHTEINDSVTTPIVSVTIIGKSGEQKAEEKLKGNEQTAIGAENNNLKIVMCGQTGLLGTLARYYQNKEALYERYSKDYLMPVEQLADFVPLTNQADLAYENGAVYCHHISRSGVFGALWELADKWGCGLTIEHARIPVLQETIEICEFTGENPYTIDGAGAILMVASDGDKLEQVLTEQGFEARVIGEFTSGKDRVILQEDERRLLTPR